MALNFPSNTTQPYIDPVSGLKYIFNPSVGAWETAIQPPAIISEGPPAVNIPGFLWWDQNDGSLYIYYKDDDSEQWVEAVPNGDLVRNVSIGDLPPANPINGDLWWSSADNNGSFQGGGRLYIYYCDQEGDANSTPGSECQWVDASPNTGNGEGGVYNGPNVTVGPNQPTDPNTGDFWFDTKTGILYIYDGSIFQNTSEGTDSESGVLSVRGEAPIIITGSSENPIVTVTSATQIAEGVTRYATQSEANQGIMDNVSISPLTLKNALQNNVDVYIPDATETQKGIIRIATDNEVANGVNNTTAVTPKKLKDQIGRSGLGNPTGAVIAFAGGSVPDGYLLCDGSEVTRTLYEDLFNVIGCDFGDGNGSTTFNLPDLRGEFIRGLDNSRGVDPNRTLGSSQPQSIQSHAHALDAGPASSVSTRAGGGNRASNTDTGETRPFPSDRNSETRPRNVALNYIIKT